MEARELRIGNLVKTCTPNMEIMIPFLEAEVQGITIFGELEFCHTPHINGFKISPKHTMGISLTEEWLIKFGFTLVSVPSAYGFDCNKVFDGGVFRGAFSKFNNPNGFYYLGFLINGAYKKIEYAHQLQNLFFALTGEELTIKEPINK